MGDVAEAAAFPAELKTFEEARLRHFHQLLRLFGDLPYGVGPCRVGVESFVDGPQIDADDVALFEDAPSRRDAVNDFLVDGDARRAGESAVAFEGRLHLMS